MPKLIKIGNVQIGDGTPKICVPLMGANLPELLHEAALAYKAGAELVEWRVDYFESVSSTETVMAALAALRAELKGMPLLFTFRTQREGGMAAMEAPLYIHLIGSAIKGGADFVDIELFTGDSEVKQVIELGRSRGVPVMVSNHEFMYTPQKEELEARLNKMHYLGASIAKIAVMPLCLSDVISLMAATDAFLATKPSCHVVAISMGEIGAITRFSGKFTGSVITFGSVNNASAPGQFTVQELRALFKVLHSG